MATYSYHHLPEPVAKAVKAFVERKALYAALQWVVSTAVIYIVLMLVITHIDRFTFLAQSTRMVMSAAAHGIVALWAMALLLLYVLRRPSLRQVLYEFESLLEVRSDERFVTLDAIRGAGAGELPETQTHVALVEQLEQEALSQTHGLRAAALARAPGLKRWTAALVVVAVICGALLLPAEYDFGLMVERFLFPGRNLEKPSFVTISIDAENLVIGKGGEIVVQADVEGEFPPVLGWIMRQMGYSSRRAIFAHMSGGKERFAFGEAQRQPMSRVQRDLFLYSRDNLQESFSFRVRCGDGQTVVRTARVVTQPKFVKAILHTKPPAELNLPSRTYERFDEPIALYEDTEVRLEVQTDQAVPSREILFDPRFEDEDDQPPLEWDEETRSGTMEWTFDESRELEIVVRNSEGFRNIEPLRINLQLLADQKPAIELTSPQSPVEVVAGELLHFRGQVTDDLGLAEIVIRYERNPEEGDGAVSDETDLETFNYPVVSYEIDHVFDLAEINAVPGDTVRLHIRARDSGENFGISEEIRVEIVPFTRGEAERRRVAALRLLAANLPALLPATLEPGGATVEAGAWQKLAESAGGFGLTVSATPAVEELLSFVEREHHYTAHWRNKRSVRHLHGVLLHAWNKAASAAPGERDAARMELSRTLDRVSEEILPGLSGFRSAKNLMARFFGMRSELLRIRREFVEMNKSEELDRSRLNRTLRRAKLYLETVQDSAEELLVFARQEDQVEEGEVSEMIEEIVTQAYRISTERGGLNPRIRAAQAVAVQLQGLLDLLVPAFRPLAVAERKAEQDLAAMYRSAEAEAAGGWFIADMKMLDRNPGQGLWARLRNRLLGLAAQGEGPDLDRLLDPSPRIREAARVEENTLRYLLHRRQREHWQEHPRLAPAERAMELLLMAAESSLRRDGGEEAAMKIFDAIEALDPAATDGLPSVPPAPEPPSGRAMLEARTMLSSAVVKELGYPAPGKWVERIRGVAGRIDTALGEYLAAQPEDGPQEARQMLRKILELKEEQDRTIEGSLEGLRLAMHGILPLGQRDKEAEFLLVRVQDHARRYQGMSRRRWATIAGTAAAEQDPTALGHIAKELRILQRTQQSFLRNLGKDMAEYRGEPPEGDGEEEDEATDGAQAAEIKLKEMEEDHARLRAAVEILRGNDPEQTLTAYLEAYPETGRIWASSRAPEIRGLVEDLTDLRERLAEDRADGAMLRDALRAAAEPLNGVLGGLERFPDAEWKGNLQAELIGVRAALGRTMPQEGTALTAEKAERVRFRIADILQQARNLAARMSGLAVGAGEDLESKFRGGPSGPARGEGGVDAEHIRERLLAIYRAASARTITHLLNGTPPEAERALRWGLLRHRLLFSGLYGRYGTEPPPTTFDPLFKHIQWLREQANEGLSKRELAEYENVTQYYLKSVKDFLRYVESSAR